MGRGKGRFTVGVTLLTLMLSWELVPAARVHSEQAAAAPDGLAAGSPMVDFGLRRLDFASGKLAAMIWLSDFVGGTGGAVRKRLLLLNFFAAWCEPCIGELPVLEALQIKHAERGLQVLSVYQRRDGESFADAVAQTRKKLDGRALAFPLLFDRYTTRNQALYLGQRAVLPCSVLIGADGVIRSRLTGGHAAMDGTLEREVERLLAEAQ